MKKSIVFCLSILFVLTSCEHEKPDDVAINSSYEMSLASRIDEYSLDMSSVPGLPMDITCDNNGETKLKLIVNCEGGSLLKWHDDGTIENLGTTYSGEFESTTLYWSPLDDNAITALTPIDFSISAYLIELEKESNRIDGEFILNENHQYVMRIE